MVINMEKESTIMDWIIFITENGNMTKNPVKGSINMAKVCIMELGKIINGTATEV
jgi:hypothetical protein